MGSKVLDVLSQKGDASELLCTLATEPIPTHGWDGTLSNTLCRMKQAVLYNTLLPLLEHVIIDQGLGYLLDPALSPDWDSVPANAKMFIAYVSHSTRRHLRVGAA